MYAFENHELGRTDDTVIITTRDENRLATLKMAQQCRYTMDIVSRELDPFLYDDPEFIEAVKKILLENHRAKIRIIVLNPQVIIKKGNRLLNLAMDLTSFIEIRKPGIEHSGFNEAVFLADSCGYIHRKKSDRYEGKINFNDRPASKYLLEHFNEMWTKANLEANFRKLHI